MNKRSAPEAQKSIFYTSSKRERRFGSRSWAILGRLGAILGLLGAALVPSWGHLGDILAPSCETQGPRNLDFTMVFAAFAPYRRSCSDLLVSFGELQLSFAILGHLGAVMGPSLAILGRLGAHLWAMLGRFGAILGHLWAVLGPSWGRSGPSWCHLGAIFRYSWAILGHLRPSRDLRNGSAAGPFAQRNSIRPHSVRSCLGPSQTREAQ